MDLWINASGQYGNEKMPVWEGREREYKEYSLHVITLFLYFHIFTYTVMVRHNVMPTNLVKTCVLRHTLLKICGNPTRRNDSVKQ